MTTVTKPCADCGTPVTREQADPVANRFARQINDLPYHCDPCIERAAAERAEEDRIFQEREREFKLHDRFKRSGLPAKHRATIGSLDHPATVREAATTWAHTGGGLLLTGEFGRGKTTLAGAACWERLQEKFVVWTSAPLLFARLGTGLGTEQRGWALDVLSSKHGLVLDDIDKARPTEYGAEQVFLAIDQRVEHEAPLLVTSNLSPSQLAEKWPEPYGPAIASRLVGYCRVLRLEGSDRRLGGLA